MITARELMLGHLILVNPLHAQAGLTRLPDLFPPRITDTGRAGNGRRPEVRDG